VDVNCWRREGNLRAGQVLSGTWKWFHPDYRVFAVRYDLESDLSAIRLTYTWQPGPPDRSVSCTVPLVTTQPAFGGPRWWFLCPFLRRGRPCGRRVAKLFIPPGGQHLGCRTCQNLTYRSCQENYQTRSLALFLAGGRRDLARACRKQLRMLRKGR
jgi:hypothetical protein